MISGSITLANVITLTGFISFSAGGNAAQQEVRITGAVSTNIQFLGSMTGSLDLALYTGTTQGVIGRVTLHRAAGSTGSIPGVGISGSVLLEVNLGFDGQARQVDTFLTQSEFAAKHGLAAPTDDNALELAVDNGGFVIDTVTLSYGLHLRIQGSLTVAVVKIKAAMDLTFDNTNGFRIKLVANGSIDLGPLGSVAITNSGFIIDGNGLVMRLQLNVNDLGSALGIKINGAATIELNTASYTRAFQGFDPASTSSNSGPVYQIASGFKLHVNATVEFLGLATGTGSVDVIVRNGAFEMAFDLTIDVGPFSLQATGGAGIYADGAHSGIALRLGVSLDVNLFEIVKLNATGELQLNTSDIARAPGGVSIGREVLPARALGASSSCSRSSSSTRRS